MSQHLTYLEAVVTGLIQGVTELFPVSSLGHNVLLPALIGGNWASTLNVSAPSSPYLAFIVGLHVATAIAMIAFFWRDWLRIVRGFFTSLRTRSITTPDERLAWMIILATIPVGIVGAALQNEFVKVFARPELAALFLAVNGLILLGSERMRRAGGTGASGTGTGTPTVVLPAGRAAPSGPVPGGPAGIPGPPGAPPDLADLADLASPAGRDQRDSRSSRASSSGRVRTRGTGRTGTPAARGTGRRAATSKGGGSSSPATGSRRAGLARTGPGRTSRGSTALASTGRTRRGSPSRDRASTGSHRKGRGSTGSHRKDPASTGQTREAGSPGRAGSRRRVPRAGTTRATRGPRVTSGGAPGGTGAGTRRPPPGGGQYRRARARAARATRRCRRTGGCRPWGTSGPSSSGRSRSWRCSPASAATASSPWRACGAG